MASSRNLVSTIGALAKSGTEPGVRKGKRSLLACHTRCKCSMETTRNSVKVKVGNQGHEIDGKSDWLGSHCWSRVVCHLTLVRGKQGNFILLNKIPVSTSDFRYTVLPDLSPPFITPNSHIAIISWGTDFSLYDNPFIAPNSHTAIHHWFFSTKTS